VTKPERQVLWTAFESLLVTLWVGSLWAVGYIAAPILFNVLDDRALAGTLAGQMFTVVAWLGIVAGSAFLLGNLVVEKAPVRWRVIVVSGMLVLVMIGHFVLQPMIAELRAAGIPEGSSAAAEFGRLHGIASILYVLTSLLGLVLVLFSPLAGQD